MSVVREEGDSSSPCMSLTGIDLTGGRIMAKNVPHFRWAGFDGSRSSQGNTAGVMQAVSRKQQLKCSNFKSFVCVLGRPSRQCFDLYILGGHIRLSSGSSRGQ